MSRIAKKSDLEKDDLKKFSIGLTEARSLKITKDDLKGITEIIPNKKYKIRITSGNRKALTFNGTLLEAIKRKKEIEKIEYKPKEIEEKINENKGITFMEGIELYINGLFDREDRDEIDINTVYDHYKKIGADITDFFKNYRINEITPELIENFIDTMRQRPNKVKPEQKLSEQTIANHLRTLNTILNYWVKKRIIPSNPYLFVNNKPKNKKGKKELNYFKIFEAKYALKCLDKFADIRLKAFMNIIFSLGCRREEACGLRWCDINFETNEVDYTYAETSSVPKGFLLKKIERDKKLNIKSNKNYNRIRTKPLKTDNSYRTNYLSDVAIGYLKNYYQFKIACGIDVKPTDPIFTNYREGRNIDYSELTNDDLIEENKPCDPSKLSANWRTFKIEYNIKDVDLHRIRHTVANILEKQGVPKKDIAKMLGNTERVLEEYYTHVDVDDLKNLRKKLDNELFDDIKYINLSIDLIVKILNDYPMSMLNEDELKIIDLINYVPVNDDNYIDVMHNVKDIILTTDGSLNYFIDDNPQNLNIKLETYKRFNNNTEIKIKREKDISITRDILSF